MSAKTSAELHDHIDNAISTDLNDKSHMMVPSVFDNHEHEDVLDKTHLSKIASHLMSTPKASSDEDEWSRVSRRASTLSEVLNHSKTDPKTINEFFDHSMNTGEAVDLSEDTVNKPGVDTDKLTSYLAKQIESNSAGIEPVGVSSDILRRLKDKSANMKPDEQAKYHGFIGRSYAQGHRDEKDFADFQPILKNVYQYSDDNTLKKLFEPNHDVSHNSLIESYHGIDHARRQKMLKDPRFNPLDHPNIDKDYIASAALDSGHELNKKALQSRHLPPHVIDRLISDNNNEAIGKVIESDNLAPEHVEKLTEHALSSGDSDLMGKSEQMLKDNASKLPKDSISKLYSLIQANPNIDGAGASLALAESPNASDELFMDAVNKDYQPSLYDRKVTPELAEQLSDKPEYTYQLLSHEDVPDSVKTKVAISKPYKEISNVFNGLPFEAKKSHFDKMVASKKFVGKLAYSTYSDQNATPEIKSQAVDLSVKALNSKASVGQSAHFFAQGLKSNDHEIRSAFDKLKDKPRARLINELYEHTDNYNVNKPNIPLTKTDVSSLMKNDEVSGATKLAILEHPTVDAKMFLHLASDMHPENTWEERNLVNKATSKIDAMNPAEQSVLFQKGLNSESFHYLSNAMQAALLSHPKSDIHGLDFGEGDLDKAFHLMDMEGESNLMSKMNPAQLSTFLSNKKLNNFSAKDWNTVAKTNHDTVLDFLSQHLSSENVASKMSQQAVHELGHGIIDRGLHADGISDVDTHVINLASLYRYEQDPGHVRLKNVLARFPYKAKQIASVIEGQTKKHPFKDESITKDLTDFAPGNPLQNEDVWRSIVDFDGLPGEYKYKAALSSPRIAVQHVNSAKDHIGTLKSIDQLLSDPNVGNNTYARMLDEKNTALKFDPANEDAHRASLMGQIISGLQANKIDSDNYHHFHDTALSVVRESKDKNVADDFASRFVDELTKNTNISATDKVKTVSGVLESDNVSPNAKSVIVNRLINTLAASGDYTKLSLLGGSELANNSTVWTPKELNTGPINGIGKFVNLASSKLVHEETGEILNEQNWLHASKAMVDNIKTTPPEACNPNLGKNLGKFIAAGARNPNTKDVANVMARAWATKMSTVGHSENGVHSLTEGLSETPEALFQAFDGIQGPCDVGSVEKSVLHKLADRVVNDHQAAAIMSNVDYHDPASAKFIDKFSGMITEGSQLGQWIGTKLTSAHHYMQSEQLNSIVNTLATKDSNGFFAFLGASRESVAESAKAVSAIALNLPVAIKTTMSVSDPESEAPRMAFNTMSSFNELLKSSKTEGLGPEDGIVARNHYTSNYLDSTDYIVKNMESETMLGSLCKAIYQKFDTSMREQPLTKDQTDKVFQIAETIQSKPENAYSKSAIGTVQYVGFSNGDFDHAGLHSVLTKYPSSIFAAVGNKNFTIDHLQHFKPASFLSDMARGHENIGTKLLDMTTMVTSFFSSLRQDDEENQRKWSDEDRTKILHKGFEYLTEHAKHSKETPEMYHSVSNLIRNIALVAQTPTVNEECLNFITANRSMECVPFLSHLTLTPDQNEIAIGHLERGMDFYNSMPKTSWQEVSNLLSGMDFNENVWNRIKDTWANKNPVSVFTSVASNKKLTSDAVKQNLVDSIIRLKNGDAEVDGMDKLCSIASSLPVVQRHQFDELTKGVTTPKIFGNGTFKSNDIYRNIKFGGDKFREKGITEAMKDKFYDLTGHSLKAEGPIKFHHGKELESFNQLLGMVPPSGLNWKDFKRANPKLAENQKIKDLFMANKEVVTPDLVTKAMSRLPGSYHITFCEWNGMQRHSSNNNLVVQFNLDKSFEENMAQDPELHQFFVDMSYESNNGHPTAPRTLFWTRLDATSPKAWIIEEIQSDFDSTLRTLSKNVKQDGSVDVGGKQYTKDQLNRFFKYFSKTLADHVDVAHKYVEQLAKEQGVKTLFLHGKEKRAKMSDMDTDKDLPEWLEYKYHTWPSKHNWTQTDDSKYPRSSKQRKGKPVWMKKLS